MNKLRRCLKPRLPAWSLAVLIWPVTIRYSRGLGESSFGPLRPSPANPGRRNPIRVPHPECHTEFTEFTLVTVGRHGAAPTW